MKTELADFDTYANSPISTIPALHSSLIKQHQESPALLQTWGFWGKVVLTTSSFDVLEEWQITKKRGSDQPR